MKSANWCPNGNLSRNGGTISSGIYLVRARTEDGKTVVRKAVYIR